MKSHASIARDLMSPRVVTVEAEHRLRDVVAQIVAKSATHCAVLDTSSGKFLGIVRLADIAERSTDRIFADLVSTRPPLDIQEKMESSLVLKLLEARGDGELVVLSAKGSYVGVITRESALQWLVNQQSGRKRG